MIRPTCSRRKEPVRNDLGAGMGGAAVHPACWAGPVSLPAASRLQVSRCGPSYSARSQIEAKPQTAQCRESPRPFDPPTPSYNRRARAWAGPEGARRAAWRDRPLDHGEKTIRKRAGRKIGLSAREKLASGHPRGTCYTGSVSADPPFGSGSSVSVASVRRSTLATETAFSSARRTTLVGSMIPASTRST